MLAVWSVMMDRLKYFKAKLKELEAEAEAESSSEEQEIGESDKS